MDFFLIALALVWISFASLQDLKKREIYNWISFSLIGFALAYRAIYSVINSDLMFLIYGLLGLAVFVIVGYGFYYARVFAGGDAKLLMALGAVLPMSSSLLGNVAISLGFILLLLIFGSLWGIFYSGLLVLGNKRRFLTEFRKQYKRNRNLLYGFILLAVVVAGIVALFFDTLMFVLPLVLLLFPLLYIYGKAVEESCLVIFVSSKELTVGDWLYSQVRVGKRIIKPNWEGLSESELTLLRKSRKKIEVRYGIPFVPSFFFAFLALIFFLRYPSWSYLELFF